MNAGILREIEGCAQVEVIYVKAHKAYAFAVEGAINSESEELQ